MSGLFCLLAVLVADTHSFCPIFCALSDFALRVATTSLRLSNPARLRKSPSTSHHRHSLVSSDHKSPVVATRPAQQFALGTARHFLPARPTLPTHLLGSVTRSLLSRFRFLYDSFLRRLLRRNLAGRLFGRQHRTWAKRFKQTFFTSRRTRIANTTSMQN